MTVKILNGNELIVQGALEAGFSLYTGYPGSPLADYFNILHKQKTKLKERGIKVVIANSEANAAAMASGAKQVGRDVLVAMKSMGLHVAADALSVGNFANPGAETIDPKTGEKRKSGVVIVVGDDPWSMSTSTPADSRYLFKHLHIPFLEPSTPQELKDWMKVALEISKRTSVYQGVLLTTFMAEGGGRVEISPAAEVPKELVRLDTSTFNLSENVMVPPNSLVADRTMIDQRFPKIQKVLKELALDQQLGVANSKIGFLSSGVVFETLKQVLEEGDYLSQFSLYKLACSYPLVEDLLVPYLKQLDTLIVVEEKRDFLETEIAKLCQEHGIKLHLLGKKFDMSEGFPAHGGLSYEIIRDKLKLAFEILAVKSCHDLDHEVLTLEGGLPRRLPTFCPGCPHRETLSLLKEIRGILKTENIDLVTHGDVGCYSLSFLPPFKEMHNLSAMGQGGALGAGLDLFSENPSVVLMGDSTFFHSGMTDISNSLQAGHTITYILLDNDNTAMTGHQMTPASGESVDGSPRPRQSMLAVVQSLGVEQSVEVNPSDRYFYRNLLLEHIKKPGVKVIVSNKECALTFQAKLKARERKELQDHSLSVKSFFQINTDACEDCRVCVELTGCPGLSQTFDAYGTKVFIDPQICVADSYCTKFKVCPSFERVDVKDYHPTQYKKFPEVNPDIHLDSPLVIKSFEDLGSGTDWRVVVTGVGGSGITTISRVLSQAATKMNGRVDLDFKFMDQKGLAQRNGNVTGHLAIFKRGKSHSAVTPLGTADLLLSPDLLDGSSQINFLGMHGEMVVDEKFQVPLSILLDNGEKAPPMTADDLKQKLQQKLGGRVSFYSLKDLCELALGKAVYASAMILGVAFQKGRLPFTLENMQEAFEHAIPKHELENNLLAFFLGRRVVVDGMEPILAEFEMKKTDESKMLELYRKSILASFPVWKSTKLLMKFYNRDFEKLCSFFPSLPKRHLMQYIHDLYIFDRGQKSERFLIDAGTISKLYPEKQWALSLRTLAKTYWIKDEVYVAHLMVSPLKVGRDQQHFGELGQSFTIKRLNRPSFDLFGKKIEFDISPKTWMLKIMRHMRILRVLLPNWHKKEKQINVHIRNEILNKITKLDESQQYEKLKELENIKGYREVRYEKFAKIV